MADNEGNETTSKTAENETRMEPTGHDQKLPDNTKDDKADKQGDSFIPENNMQNSDRMVLFEKAVRLKRSGNLTHALHCFLCCLQDLREGSRFPVLPDCLHNIAEIYYKQQDFESAIHFAQAEKLYYETILMTAVDEDEKPVPKDSIPYRKPQENGTNNNSQNSDVPQSMKSDEAEKAAQYEKLAHMCLKQENPQLALDYCAKAVKLQQRCYGEQHPITLQTLDLFTVIYAEMGKQQYKAAFEKFTAAQMKGIETKEMQKTTSNEERKEELIETSTTPVNNNTETTEIREEESNRNEEVQNGNQPGDHAEEFSLTYGWAMFLYLVLTIIVSLGVTMLLGYITQTDIYTTYNYMTTRIKFYYYYYIKHKLPGGNKYF